MESPASLEDVQDAVRSLDRVRVIGGGSKPALSAGATLSMAKLRGLIEYEPTEYTFTAFAGTPLSEIRDALAKNGQAMAFDPPLVEAGATLGGTTAAALSGPGRFRYGGLRDFLLGVRLVTGEGRIVFGGGKVVKNAAGFDIPKLMAGACGSLGVLVELTFKVFPQPETYATLCIDLPDLNSATRAMTRLAMSPAELTCLDLDPTTNRLWLRVGGLADAIDQRIERIRSIAADGTFEVLRGADDQRVWSDAREFRWRSAEHGLIKVPISPGQVPVLEAAIATLGVAISRRYSVGGNVCWLAWPQSLSGQKLDELCRSIGRPALVLAGDFDATLRARKTGGAFEQRLRNVFDPSAKLA